eukprot:jgi/Botrbrau1/16091/Bobra.7_2s0058.2
MSETVQYWNDGIRNFVEVEVVDGLLRYKVGKRMVHTISGPHVRPIESLWFPEEPEQDPQEPFVPLRGGGSVQLTSPHTGPHEATAQLRCVSLPTNGAQGSRYVRQEVPRPGLPGGSGPGVPTPGLELRLAHLRLADAARSGDEGKDGVTNAALDGPRKSDTCRMAQEAVCTTEGTKGLWDGTNPAAVHVNTSAEGPSDGAVQSTTAAGVVANGTARDGTMAESGGTAAQPLYGMHGGTGEGLRSTSGSRERTGNGDGEARDCPNSRLKSPTGVLEGERGHQEGPSRTGGSAGGSKAGEAGQGDGRVRHGEPAEMPAGGLWGITVGQSRKGALVKKDKWIYVLDANNRLFVAPKVKGRIHHSSLSEGGVVRAAGTIVVKDGLIEMVTAWSGHYPAEA